MYVKLYIYTYVCIQRQRSQHVIAALICLFTKATLDSRLQLAQVKRYFVCVCVCFVLCCNQNNSDEAALAYSIWKKTAQKNIIIIIVVIQSVIIIYRSSYSHTVETKCDVSLSLIYSKLNILHIVVLGNCGPDAPPCKPPPTL